MDAFDLFDVFDSFGERRHLGDRTSQELNVAVVLEYILLAVVFEVVAPVAHLCFTCVLRVF